MHELIHAFGLYHEQSRPDRDLYIEIKWENIKADYRGQFAIAKGTATYGVAYDPKSIMHYSTSAFNNGNGNVMEAKVCFHSFPVFIIGNLRKR